MGGRTNLLPVRGRGGRPHRGVCVCSYTSIQPTPLSSLPLLLALTSPPLPLYLLYYAFSSSIILLPLHSLSLPDLHLISTSITLPSCFVSLITLSCLFPPLLVLTARCIGQGQGKAGSYPRSLSTSDEHMGNGAGDGEWGGYYPGGAEWATTTRWSPKWEGTLPSTPSRGDKDCNWRSTYTLDCSVLDLYTRCTHLSKICDVSNVICGAPTG